MNFVYIFVVKFMHPFSQFILCVCPMVGLCLHSNFIYSCRLLKYIINICVHSFMTMIHEFCVHLQSEIRASIQSIYFYSLWTWKNRRIYLCEWSKVASKNLRDPSNKIHPLNVLHFGIHTQNQKQKVYIKTEKQVVIRQGIRAIERIELHDILFPYSEIIIERSCTNDSEIFFSDICWYWAVKKVLSKYTKAGCKL